GLSQSRLGAIRPHEPGQEAVSGFARRLSDRLQARQVGPGLRLRQEGEGFPEGRPARPPQRTAQGEETLAGRHEEDQAGATTLALRRRGGPCAPYCASSTSLRPQIMLASCLLPPGPCQCVSRLSQPL